MRSLSVFARNSAALAAMCGFATLVPPAQTFAAGVGVPAPAMVTADGPKNHVNVPVHRHGDDKLIFAKVRDGVYTVDGMVAKVHLNYDVQGSSYMYLFVPGIGTAVLSMSADGKAVITPATLHMDELTFTVDGHHYNLSGVSMAGENGKAPAHLYVRMDRAAWHLNRTPMVGFGNRAELPYEWPGALPPELTEDSRDAPPLPPSVLPKPATLRPVQTSSASGVPVLKTVDLH